MIISYCKIILIIFSDQIHEDDQDPPALSRPATINATTPHSGHVRQEIRGQHSPPLPGNSSAELKNNGMPLSSTESPLTSPKQYEHGIDLNSSSSHSSEPSIEIARHSNFNIKIDSPNYSPDDDREREYKLRTREQQEKELIEREEIERRERELREQREKEREIQEREEREREQRKKERRERAKRERERREQEQREREQREQKERERMEKERQKEIEREKMKEREREMRREANRAEMGRADESSKTKRGSDKQRKAFELIGELSMNEKIEVRRL